MTQADTPVAPEAPDEVIELHVPGDWLDLVLDDELELRRQVADTMLPVDQEAVLTGLLAWRARPGLLSHGVVDVHGEGVDVTWHVLSHAVPAPSDSDVDAAAVLARLLGSQVADGYVEAFDTPQGRAVGLLQEQTFPVADRSGPGGGDGGSVTSGMAVVLSLPWGSRLGLLVVGVCVAPEQVQDLAGLVTLIATRSTVSVTPS